MAPLVTSSFGDSEQIIHFQEAYARLFLNCYNKQDIHSNFLQANEPGNYLCESIYPEGVPPNKGNNCGLIPSISIRGCVCSLSAPYHLKEIIDFDQPCRDTA